MQTCCALNPIHHKRMSSMKPTDLPRSTIFAPAAPAGAQPFHVGILIGPGFVPMDMVGVQTVLGLMPGVEIHLLWKTRDLVEGFPNWWTMPTTTFADCPERLDVLAIPMLAPEVQNDPEVVAFVAGKAKTAGQIIGICNGVLLLGAGHPEGTQGHRQPQCPAHSRCPGVGEIVPAGHGVTIDGNLYTAGPGVGSFEAAFLVVEAAFGRTLRRNWRR
jgi:cyclohexyl-isocyanide hydratase